MSIDVLDNLAPLVRRKAIGAKFDGELRGGRLFTSDGIDVSDVWELTPKTIGKRWRSPNQFDELAEHAEVNGGFVFALYQTCEPMENRFSTFSQSDMARLMYIGTYTAYGGSIRHDNGKTINRSSLEKLLGLSRSKFSGFYRKLIAEKIFEETGGELFMAPSVFYRGELKDSGYRRANLQYTRMYRKTVRDLYVKYNGRSLKQLAIIYAVLPFVNFSSNVVCFNPEETDENRLKPLDIERLAALLHYTDTHKLKQALEAIILDYKPVFYLPYDVNDTRKLRIVVNPRIVFAGSAESLRSINVLFNY